MLLFKASTFFLMLLGHSCDAFLSSVPSSSTLLYSSISTSLSAKKQRKTTDAFGDWYQDVDQDATPDDVFWEEMERQRAMAGIPSSTTSTDPFAGVGAVGTMPASSKSSYERKSFDDAYVSSPSSIQSFGSTMAEEQQSKAALASYVKFMVDDNWINQEYAKLYGSKDMEDMDLSAQDEELDRQIEEWSKEVGDSEFTPNNSVLNPWDTWNRDEMTKEDEEDSSARGAKIESARAKSELAREFLIDTDLEDYDEAAMAKQVEEEERKLLQKLGEIKLKSDMLENAKNNPKAKDFFEREPSFVDGCDRMWVAAIDNACLRNLYGSFLNYGVEFACNFGDWEDGCPSDAMQSIEDIASFKARTVFGVTGLPTIASRTSFEVEPARVPDRRTPMNRGFENTRISSGYKFNDVGDHVDYIVEALKPYSEPTRKTRFKSCFCYYDGEMEIFDYGELDCDIYFANSLRTYIPMSVGITEIGKTLQLTFGLEFQGLLRKKIRETLQKSDNRVSIKLRDRVLKDAKVLPNNIVDVSSFMDSMVDVNLMDDCAKELSTRFEKLKPNKILTIATTGLVLAIPMAKYLQVPVVYARKERNVVMSDTFIAGFSSNTVGKNRELLVSKNHLSAGENILIIDDFLSSGASQEALLRIISDAGAKAVGIGVLIEKSYEAGRKSLSGFDIPVESLVRIASVSDGIITLEEEEGFEAM